MSLEWTGEQVGLTEVELAYAAGFFDGEGCVGIYDPGDGSLRLDVSIAHRAPCGFLHRLHGEFGGYLGPTGGGRYLQWRIHTRRALRFLQAIRPFMRLASKVEQVDIAIGFQLRKVVGVGLSKEERAFQEWAAQELKRIKEEGPDGN